MIFPDNEIVKAAQESFVLRTKIIVCINNSQFTNSVCII